MFKENFAQNQLLRNFPADFMGLWYGSIIDINILCTNDSVLNPKSFCSRKFPFSEELFEALTPVILVISVPMITMAVICIFKKVLSGEDLPEGSADGLDLTDQRDPMRTSISPGQAKIKLAQNRVPVRESMA